MSKFVEKTHVNRAPTLLIGVGGIGGQILKNVSESMSDYDKSCIRMIVMDTDSNDIGKLMKLGIPYVQTSENQTVQAYLASNPEFLEWFPTDPFINAKSLINGAGQIRSVSRLGALASKNEGKFEIIRKAIDNILSNQGDALERAVRVMIVGSVTGGTGSGLGIQLPFYIRRVLKEANVPNVLIRGLFVMPSLTEDVQRTLAMKSAVNVNGYAFLKELNAFYHAQKVEKEDNLLKIEEYVPGLINLQDGTADVQAAAMVPYDFLYLVEKRSSQGIIGDLNDYINRTSQIVTNQLFSPVSNRGYSSEDNLITSIVPQGGMNRYCGAGISNAIYPKDEVVRYCTVRYAQQLIDEYWLTIDKEFKKRDERQRNLKKSNPSLQALEKSKVYCEIFDDICDPTKHEVSSEIAELKGELSIDLTDKEGKKSTMPVVQSIMTNIESHMNEEFGKTKLFIEAEKCKLTVKTNTSPEDVATEVTAKMQSLRELKKSAESTISNLIGAVAQGILPADIKSAKDYSKDVKYNIYVALNKKHPIIVRYVMYSLLNEMKKAKREVDARLTAQGMRVSIFNKDYFIEGKDNEEVENPIEALDKTRKGILAFIGLYSGSYKSLITTFKDDFADEANSIINFSRLMLNATVYRIVIERLEVMIDLYEKFFDELEKITENKSKEEKALEAGRGEGENNVFAGDRYICSDAKCKNYLYDTFKRNVTDRELQMSDDVKKHFFDKMFEEYETLLIEKDAPSEITAHISPADMFEKGILLPIVNQFKDNGFKHLDMGILDAIYLQYRIENDVAEENKYSDDFKEYFRGICSTLTTLAEPYMLYERNVAGYVSGGITSYSWGLNYSAVADYQNGNPEAVDVDNDKVRSLFGNISGENVLDDSFSPYSLTCYASIYDLRVENCISYNKGSRTEQCYAERLRNLANREHFIISTNRDNEIDVIHPHLNRRWHEHAYLPELMEYDDKKMCEDIRRAFIMAFALGKCKYIENKVECINCWCYKSVNEKGKERLQPVLVNGEELKTKSIYAMYCALDSNRVMVSNINEHSEEIKASSKNDCAFGGVNEEIIIEQKIIKGLINTGFEVGTSILDIIYEVYKNTLNRELIEAIVKTLEDYIYEYCLFMFGNNENRARALSNNIKFKIGEASDCLKDSSVSAFFKEDVANFINEE